MAFRYNNLVLVSISLIEIYGRINKNLERSPIGPCLWAGLNIDLMR